MTAQGFVAKTLRFTLKKPAKFRNIALLNSFLAGLQKELPGNRRAGGVSPRIYIGTRFFSE
jgi:hypothetical protein